MNILVCIKQAPDTTEIHIDPETNTLSLPLEDWLDGGLSGYAVRMGKATLELRWALW